MLPKRSKDFESGVCEFFRTLESETLNIGEHAVGSLSDKLRLLSLITLLGTDTDNLGGNETA